MKTSYEAYIFDLDGTVYLGDQLIDGAKQVIDELQSKGKQILFLTNKTIVSRDSYVKKLNGLRIHANLDNVLNPTVTLIQYLKKHYHDARYYVIGEELIKNELQAAGFQTATTPKETDIVIISWDRDFHYQHLNFAYQAIKNGAKSIATNPDRTCPVVGGDVPDCGAIIGAIEGATGKNIDLVIGKPSYITANIALDLLNIDHTACLMVGDRLETDVFLGKEAEIDTALVLSGVTKEEDINQSPYTPDYVLNSIGDLIT